MTDRPYDPAAFTGDERAAIDRSVRTKYRKVAKSPEKQFKYPTGRAGMEALGYDRDLIRALPERVAASYCGPGNPFALGVINPGDRVLDIGCGAGVDTIIAAMMAGQKGSAAGVDMAPEMLGRARDNLAEVELGNVEFREASAETLPFADKSFDVAISNGVFNLVVDKPRALAEARRVLKPGGRLMMTDQLLAGQMPKETAAIVKSWGR